jgi:putative ABC transport system permease protein
VLALVLAQGARPALGGIAIGVIGALSSSRALAGLLYQVEANDPATLIGVSVLLAAVATVAGALPAYRASRVDPISALRCE